MKSSKKKYNIPPASGNRLHEPAAAYYSAQDGNWNSLKLMGLDTEDTLKPIENTVDFINRIREGIPKAALDHLAAIIGFSSAEMAGIVHTSDRTLRRYSSDQRLTADQSERVVELAKLYARGAEVFDSLELFKTWMLTPIDALGAKMPKEFLDTSMGIDLLMDELGRIEHGIFA
jgi:putative toxin-antitoxin system antitoxin component (TIGR02293 family)